jgi:hypothetical protein
VIILILLKILGRKDAKQRAHHHDQSDGLIRGLMLLKGVNEIVLRKNKIKNLKIK